MILQIVSDEKFIDQAVDRFETATPGVSRYVMLRSSQSLRYVRSQLVEQLSEEDLIATLRSCKYDACIFHGLSPDKVALLRSIQSGVCIAWLGWGFDYYPTLLRGAYPSGLYAPMTIPIARAVGRIPSGKFQRLRAAVRKFRKRHSTLTKDKLRKINFFIPVLRSEWELSRRLNPWFRADYVPWNYPVDEPQASMYAHGDFEKRNILVGNSGDLTNNHIDAFYAVASIARPGSYDRVIVPLSYAGSQTYSSQIEEAGRHFFGSRFMPLYDFMPIAEYRALLASCHTVVMNHIRQQGVGNISMAIQLGARIVLNPASPLCAELRHRGVEIETIDSFSVGPLDDATVSANRKVEQLDIARRTGPQRTIDLVEAMTAFRLPKLSRV